MFITTPEKTYTPEKWVVVEISDGEKTVERIMAGWDKETHPEDYFRFSSVILQSDHFDDRFEFYNASGSKYVCYKQCEGLTKETALLLFSEKMNLRQLKVTLKIKEMN